MGAILQLTFMLHTEITNLSTIQNYVFRVNVIKLYSVLTGN